MPNQKVRFELVITICKIAKKTMLICLLHIFKESVKKCVTNIYNRHYLHGILFKRMIWLVTLIMDENGIR